MKILLGDFNAELVREDIFKPTTRNDSLHQDNNVNGVRIVNFATSKNLGIKSKMLLHQNIQKFTWTSTDGKMRNQIYHILIGDGIQVYSTYNLSRELTVIRITIWWLQELGKD